MGKIHGYEMGLDCQTKPGFGIYIHWPFCESKCPYCDFNSHVAHQNIDEKIFIQSYIHELNYYAETTQKNVVNSIFFGGGTPSLMDSKSVETIISAIYKRWSVSDNLEISLEANPSSADASRFRGYRNSGVNRLSLGVQSLRDKQLKFLGRLHSAEEARQAIILARDIFEQISFDLIYARPGQSLSDWQSELEEAILLAGNHLSLYQLTIEKGTAFYNLYQANKLHIPKTEQAAQLYELTLDITSHHGLPAYEISNHAKPGFECQHNLIYWRYGDYLGIGPGAHGRFNTKNGRLSTVNEYNPARWSKQVAKNGHGSIVSELLSGEEAANEMLLMGMRLNEGVALDRYLDIAGKKLNMERIYDLKEDGMLTIDGNYVSVSPRGWLVLDAIIADITR